MSPIDNASEREAAITVLDRQAAAQARHEAEVAAQKRGARLRPLHAAVPDPRGLGTPGHVLPPLRQPEAAHRPNVRPW
jgi:hypothetical protein